MMQNLAALSLILVLLHGCSGQTAEQTRAVQTESSTLAVEIVPAAPTVENALTAVCKGVDQVCSEGKRWSFPMLPPKSLGP